MLWRRCIATTGIRAGDFTGELACDVNALSSSEPASDVSNDLPSDVGVVGNRKLCLTPARARQFSL